MKSKDLSLPLRDLRKVKVLPFFVELDSDGCPQNSKAGPGELAEMAELAKYLMTVLLIPGIGGRGRLLPVAHWPACLAHIVNSRVPGQRHTAGKKKIS